MRLTCTGLLAGSITVAAFAQPNPQYMGADHTLHAPLARFPDRVIVGYMLDQGVSDRTVEMGCQNGAGAPVWATLKATESGYCDRQSNQNLRVFVRVSLCSVDSTIELKPKNVHSAWTKDSSYEGDITLLLLEKSLNCRNAFKAGRPFSVLKGC